MKILRSILRIGGMVFALLVVLLIADAAYTPLQSQPWQSVADPSEVPPAISHGR